MRVHNHLPNNCSAAGDRLTGKIDMHGVRGKNYHTMPLLRNEVVQIRGESFLNDRSCGSVQARLYYAL